MAENRDEEIVALLTRLVESVERQERKIEVIAASAEHFHKLNLRTQQMMRQPFSNLPRSPGSR